MYTKPIDIYINGKKVTIRVPCNPDTPEDRLKEKAISIYLNELKRDLYEENKVIVSGLR